MRGIRTLSDLMERAARSDNIRPSVGTACIEWARSRSWKGYGQARFMGKYRIAHRLAWELAVGPIPPGMFVCHKCDNPPCINVEHLFVGSASDNMIDMVRKGHSKTLFGRQKLSDEDIALFESLYYGGLGPVLLARRFKIRVSTAQQRIQKMKRDFEYNKAKRAAANG